MIETLLSSKFNFCNSYSMLTSQPFFVSDGQQLMLSGISVSSCD